MSLSKIRSKLTEEELSDLKAILGVDLRDPEVIAAQVELENARKQLDFVERQMLNRCAFCDRSSAAAGSLARCSQGICICKGCAESCIRAIEADDTSSG
jgi:hypothetical protein